MTKLTPMQRDLIGALDDQKGFQVQDIPSIAGKVGANALRGLPDADPTESGSPCRAANQCPRAKRTAGSPFSVHRVHAGSSSAFPARISACVRRRRSGYR